MNCWEAYNSLIDDLINMCGDGGIYVEAHDVSPTKAVDYLYERYRDCITGVYQCVEQPWVVHMHIGKVQVTLYSSDYQVALDTSAIPPKLFTTKYTEFILMRGE